MTTDAPTAIIYSDITTTPEVDSEEVKSTTPETESETNDSFSAQYDIDVDQFSDMMKKALLNSQFDVASELLSKYEYNVYFTDDEQKSIVLDTTPELIMKILQFFRDNSINFNVYDFTVFELINTKSYTKLESMFQSGHIGYSPIKYIVHAISLNDSIAVKMFSRNVSNKETVFEILEEVETKVYEKDLTDSKSTDKKDSKSKKVKYIEFKNTPALMAFINSEFVREVLDTDAMMIFMGILLNIATRVKDPSLYGFIINHPMFSSTSTRAEEYNLVFCYIDRACLPLDVNPEMIQYLLESNVDTSVIRNGLFNHMICNHAEMPSAIYDLFLKDSRNILFDLINIPDPTNHDQIETSCDVLNSLFFCNSFGIYQRIGSDDFNKIEMTSNAFLKRFTKKTRRFFMARVFEAYIRGDENVSRLKDLMIEYYYSESFQLFARTINTYYQTQMSEYPDCVEHSDYKIFEIFDVDMIERMISFTPHFHELMIKFPPEFTPAQIVFLHSKCKGKSKNSKEFVKTLKNITGKDYELKDLIDFDKIFRFDDGRQIFNSIVMEYVGLQQVEVKSENRID